MVRLHAHNVGRHVGRGQQRRQALEDIVHRHGAPGVGALQRVLCEKKGVGLSQVEARVSERVTAANGTSNTSNQPQQSKRSCPEAVRTEPGAGANPQYQYADSTLETCSP